MIPEVTAFFCIDVEGEFGNETIGVPVAWFGRTDAPLLIRSKRNFSCVHARVADSNY